METSTNSTASTPAPAQSRWRKRLAWGLGGLLALGAISWLAVPPLVKSQAEKFASEQLGRKLTVGSVDFKPWSLELEIKDLAIAQAGGQGEQLKIGRAYVNAELQSILRFAPVVDAVEIDDVRGSLVHLGDGKYDIDDILAKIAALPKSPEPASKEPPKFAIYNIALKDWALQFDDRPAGKKHMLSEFNLSLPFLSSLEAKREVKTEPRLAFALNGSRVDSTGQSTPFVQTRKTDASVSIKALDVSPYLPYLKGAMAGLPVQPVSAVLGADLKIDFEQNPKPTVRITGQVTGQGIALNDAAGQGLLAVQAIRIKAKDVQPLAGRVALEAIEISAPALQVKRGQDGQLNLQSSSSNSPKKVALNADSMPANSQKDSKNTASTASTTTPWQISIERVSLQGGSITWSDTTTSPRAQIAAQALNLQATQIEWPFVAEKPIQFEGSSMLDKGSLTFSGTATDVKASVSAQLSALPLDAAGPYLQAALIPALTGSADVQAGVLWQAQKSEQKAALQITVPKAQLSNLLLAQGKTKLAQVKSLSAQTGQIDLLAQTVNVAKLAASGVQTRVERDAQGRWMTQNWLRAASASGPTTPPATSTSTSSSDWKITLSDIELDAPQLAFIDRLPSPAAKKPVALDIAGLKARASGIELLGSELGKKPIPVNLSLNMAAGDAQSTTPVKHADDAGLIKLQGQITPAPLAVQFDGQLQRLPVHALEPYFGDALNIDLLRLDASYRGKVQVAQAASGMQIKVNGDAVLEELQTTLRGAALAASSGAVAGDELLNWKALSVKALAVDMTPGAALKIDVGEAALTDFFARVLISEQGRLNLLDIVKSNAAATSTAATTNSIALRADSMPANPTISSKNEPASPALDPIINIGQVSLINGKMFFSDRFIKPNYAANLSELTGKLGSFSSQPKDGTVQMAPLELRGKAEGTAALEIVGQLNPLAKPLALDITGKVRDLELAPLSPYSVKYAGHGIERGKLSVDVKYLIKPDGQLTASNNIVLNQIKFGDKVEGAPNSLPVKLAVALLADRNGVIDINLPVQGSLNDPQFSIGPIVFKLIINLVVKAITSPFSLLASAFGGGGDELGQVAFTPGSAQIAESAKPGLDKVVKALTDRPALKMTVVGQASAEVEREAFKKERLKALVAAEKRRSVVASGGASNATQTAAITVSDAEYPALLKEVYKRSDVPKPRNAIGLVKDIPVADMEALLLASLPVTEQAMQELATARGVAVRDLLASKGLPTDRLFLGAAKAIPAAEKEKWQPRAELNLATQ